MRDVNDGLHQALVFEIANLVEQQRQQDGRREAENHAVNVEQQRVAEHPEEHRRAEQALKILQAHPFAAPDAQVHLIVLEGDLHAIERRIFENDEEQNCRHQQQIQIPVAVEHFCDLGLFRRLWR